MSNDNLITELLSRVSRRKKSIAAKKPGFQKKIARAKKRNEKKIPSRDKLEHRALVKARNAYASKLAGGKSKSDLSISQKEKIEKRLSSPPIKAKLARAARKGISIEKKAAAAKRASLKNKAKNEEVVTESQVFNIISEILESNNLKKKTDVELLSMFDAAKKAKDKKLEKTLTVELKKRGALTEAFPLKVKKKKKDPDGDGSTEKYPEDSKADDEEDSKEKKKNKKGKKDEIIVHENNYKKKEK